MQYRPEVDGLRAVAVVPVVLFHAGFQAFAGGYVGVDVFFVISGYLITTIIVGELHAGRFSLLTFWERRARRILPALLFVAAACVPLAMVWLSPRELEDFARGLIATATFTSNIYFWRSSGYFDPESEFRPLLHTWSLAIEEQFYILFPLFLLLVWMFARRLVVALLVLGLAASFALAQLTHQDMPVAAFYLLPMRGWELLVGALVAVHIHARGRPEGNPYLAALGLAMILYAIFAFDAETPFPSVYTLVPTLGTALVILYAAPGTLIFRVMSNRLLVGIGLVSYSTYLWHQPLFAFARHASLEPPDTGLLLVLSALSVALAYLTWRLVEVPFRARAWISRRTVFSAGAAGMGLMVAVGVVGIQTNLLGPVFFGEAQRQIYGTAEASPRIDDCHTDVGEPYDFDQACRYHFDEAPVAVIGNSHAVELALALADELRPSRLGVRHFSVTGCRPSYGLDTEDVSPGNAFCARWATEAVEHIAADEEVETVVVSYANYNVTDEQWQAYVKTAEVLIAAGKDVVLVLQAPRLPRDVAHLVRLAETPDASVVGRSRSEWQAQYAPVIDRIDELPEEATVIDPVDRFCDGDACWAVKDGTALYFDNHHMSLAGAAMIAAEIARRVTQRLSG